MNDPCSNGTFGLEVKVRGVIASHECTASVKGPIWERKQESNCGRRDPGPRVTPHASKMVTGREPKGVLNAPSEK